LGDYETALATEFPRFEYDRALLVLDKKADYKEWSNNVKKAIKGGTD
jgi:hypothetical protein